VEERVVVGEDGVARCPWAGSDPLYRSYHDDEWGRPTADDRRLFEKLCLEGFQSGLSWLTILRKRPNFRAAFADFDPAAVAAFGPVDVERLMADAGIVRNRAKIQATINNARRYPALIEEWGSLAAFLWSHEPAAPKAHASLTPESVALSKALRKRGWAFVGPTTAYAAMQATGIVNDHLDGCSFRAMVDADRAEFVRPQRRDS
jgi:DNA-3-methyladenine glycosylase I